MAERLSGQCLCGAVKFTAVPEKMEMGVCHCGMCRRWTGGTFMAVDCGQSVEFTPDAPVGAYRGSAWAERLFCKECGSTLVWQMQNGKHQSASAQAFDDPSAFKFTSQIYTDHKPPNYDFANETRMMTEAEIIAMFAPEAGETSQ